jgi:hypothetical protein
VVQGDIEFHIRTSDWLRHGHHRDANYNRVVLHVVWQHDGKDAERQDGVIVPTLEVGHTAVTQLQTSSLRSTQPTLLPHPCVGVLSLRSSDSVAASIRDSGYRRFHERAARYEADLEATTPDEVLYGALLEAMGYASNRETFRRLADCVPFTWLQSLPTSSWPQVLLQAAGFGEATNYHPPASLPADSWRIARIRPGNHPSVRIAGVATLLGQLGSRPAERLADVISVTDRPSRLRSLLVAQVDGKPAIGQGRADEVAVSVVLPFVRALDQGNERATELFGRYPSPPATRWTRTMLETLRAAGHTGFRVRGAVEHQGLHHLYTGHCRFGRRQGCPTCSGV